MEHDQPPVLFGSLKEFWLRSANLAIHPQSFLITLALGAAFIYGMELFGFNLSIDEELWGEATEREQLHLHWLRSGRWFWYLLSGWVIPYPIVPTFPLALGLATYLLGCFLILSLWQPRFSLDHILAGLVLLAYPTLIFVLSYSMNYGVGLGFLFVAVGMTLQMSRGSPGSLILAGGFYALALASYQSLIFVAPTIFLVANLKFALSRSAADLPLSRYFLRQGVRLCLALLIGVLLYYGVWKLLLWLSREAPEYILDTYWHPEALLKHPSRIFHRVYQYMLGVYVSGDADFYIDPIRSLPMLLLLSTAALGFAIARARLGRAEKFLCLFLLLCLYWVPFLLHFINNGEMPVRSLVSLPLVVAGILYLGLANAGGLWKRLLQIVSLFAILEFSIIDLRLQNATHLALEADRAFGARLLERIDQAVARNKETPWFIEFVGYHAFPETSLRVKREHIGASFFAWDMGNTYRMTAFLKVLGLRKLYPAPEEKRRTLMPMTAGLTIWPDEGSVRVIGDTVVVKLGDYSQGQLELLCSQAAPCRTGN